MSFITFLFVFYRKRKERHEGGAPSGFSRFPTEGDSDEEEEYEKEKRKRSECLLIFRYDYLLFIHFLSLP